MRGKYKRKRLRKLHNTYVPIIKRYRNDIGLFCEEMFGVKLFWYQKVYLKCFYRHRKEEI